MIAVCTLLWAPNANSKSFSVMYTPAWVDKLARGFARNLTLPHRFVCFADRPYEFAEDVETVQIKAPVPDYGTCIEPYALGEPMILVGLDTVVTGNIDHLADYCLTADRIALPRDPYKPSRACNGVALVPAGHEHIATEHRGENDMDHVRSYPHRFLDDEFPGEVVSYKGSVEASGLGKARIVYFHGERKPHQLPTGHPILEHWI